MKRLHVADDALNNYSSHPKVKSCGAIVFHNFDDGVKYLVIKTHEKFGNSWDFPKGAMESSETELQTAIREVREETGLIITVFDEFRSEIHYLVKRGEILKTAVYFLGKTTDTIVKLDKREVEAYEWLVYEDALIKLTYDHSKDLLTKANNMLLKLP